MDNQVQTLTFNMLPMTIGVLPSSYVDSMSYYETLLWLCNYLENTVIPTVNNNGEAVEELQSAYITLHDYVEHYFDNLDVQTEINNKLDQMTEDGTLTNLIKGYVDPIYEAYEQSIHDYLLAESQSNLNFRLTVNDQIESLSDRVNLATSGSPKGVYATVSALETADPDHDSIYLVTADGKWYYYDTNYGWTAGGTYQSTGISSKSITYDSLDDSLRKQDFIEVHAEDILWKNKFSYANGSIDTNQKTVGCLPFLLPKGNTITISSDFKQRVTYYDMNFNYIGNTGTFAVQVTPFSYTQTVYCTIALIKLEDGEEVAADETDVNNTDIAFTGLVEKDSYEFGKGLGDFAQYSTTRMWRSKPFYLNKGDKIAITHDILIKNDSMQNGGFYLQLIPCNTNNPIAIEYSVRKDYVTATYTGMYQLAITFVNTTDMSADYCAKLPTFIKVIRNNYFIDNRKIFLYSSGNARITYKYSGSALLLNLADNLNIIRQGVEIAQITMASLATDFPDNITTDGGVTYLSIPGNKVLYLDLVNNTLKMDYITTANMLYGTETFVLLYNKSANCCGGELLEYITKQKLENLRYDEDMYNSQPYGDYDYLSIIKAFGQKYVNKDNIDTFLFFTDPHLSESNGNDINEKTLIKLINPMEKVYNSLPLEFIMCGGDWLTGGDSQAIASYKLGYLTQSMYAKFKNYYQMVGNHDTNNYGKETSESEPYTGMWDTETINNLMFPFSSTNYYSFKTKRSTNYVLDTYFDTDYIHHIGWTMTEYMWGQIDWLADSLVEDNPEHSVVFAHIIWDASESHNPIALVDPLTKLIDAFNNHTTVTLNSTEYDFTGCTGHVDYVLGGHTHADMYNTYNNVLCVATKNFNVDGTANNITYDIIMNDYDNGKLIMYRVGSGDSREFDI